jgi:ankyrin repeat protein
MNIRNLLISLGFRVLIVFLCVSVVGIHYIFAAGLFRRNATVAEVEKTIQEGSVDARNDDGVTGLMFAADQGMVDRAKAYLNSGANVNAKSTQFFMTPLLFAIYSADSDRNFEIVDLLLDAHADVRARGEIPMRQKIKDAQPWHYLINVQGEKAYKAIGKSLVNAGSDVNVQTNNGYTLLHLAVEANDLERLQFTFAQFGSLIDLDKKLEVVTDDGIKLMTPQEYALFLRFDDAANLFLNTKLNVVGYYDGPVPKPEVIYDRDPNGLDALMVAVVRNDEKQVKKLFGYGANVNTISDDVHGESALQLAILHRLPNMVRILLDAGADVAYIDKKGDTVLHLLPRVYDPEMQKMIFDLLLANPKNRSALARVINHKNDRGDTPLHVAVEVTDAPFLKRLVEEFSGAIDSDVLDDRKLTAGQLADRWKRFSLIPIFDMLREQKAKVALSFLKHPNLKPHSVALLKANPNWRNVR